MQSSEVLLNKKKNEIKKKKHKQNMMAPIHVKIVNVHTHVHK